MAIVKFKSGDKATLLGNASVTPAVLPLAIDPGTVYFAVDENNKGSIYFDKDSTHRITMCESYAEYAEVANKDSSNNVITTTYLKDITFASATDSSDNKIKVIATLTKGNGATLSRLLPIAGPSLAGIITPEAQTLAGDKTFTGAATFSGGITFSNINFNYSSIEAGTTNSARVVWFADASKKGKPVYDNDFTYNPYTNTLTATNFAGTATNATNDAGGTAINTYLHDVSLDSAEITFTFTRGSGQTLTLTPKSAIIRRWTAS